MKSLIKRVLKTFRAEDLPEKLVKLWTSGKEYIQFKILYPIVLLIPYGQNFYFIFSKPFAYEMKLFVRARREYLKNNYKNKENIFLLRRNIHRLEKGLLMENRRQLFALDYIEETVLMLKTISTNTAYSEQIQWAFDVLLEYFNVTADAPQINKAYQVFKTITSLENNKKKFIPYEFSNHTEIEDCEESFKALVHKRKSIRYFDQENLPDREQIDKAILLAGMAPSSCNRQPYKFIVIDNPDLIKKIAPLPSGTKGFSENIKAMIAVIGQMNVSPSIGDRHLMYVDGSLASMNLMLALESMNISSCPLNWPENIKKDNMVRDLLSLKKYERPIMMIAYGYADKSSKVACSVRKSIDEIRKYY